MAINFPSNPTTGQVYEYQNIRWQWNGVAWDKYEVFTFNGLTANVEGVSSFNGFTGAVGICAGNQIYFTLSGHTYGINVLEGKGSDLDADLLQGVSGARFLENLQTGLLYGGILSINAGNTATFDISGGQGIIVDINGTTASEPDPIITRVAWNTQTGVTLPISSHDITYISINSTGSIVKSSTIFSNTEYETTIPIGALIHPSRSYISFAKTYPHVAYGQAIQTDPFIRAFGPLKLSGHEISGYDATLRLVRSSGTAYDLGRNYSIDSKNPDIVFDTDANPVPVIYRTYRGITAGTFITDVNTAVDPTKYDDGTGTLATVAGGRYSIQRIFYYPTEPTVLQVYYGRTLYNSIDSAKAGLFFEKFNESEDSARSAIFCGFLIIKSGISNFSAVGDYEFIQGGLFRSTTNIGGGGVAVASIDDLSDVTITTAANNDLLRYNSATSQWVNTPVTGLPLVSSFNGNTGAVTGVSTFNGLTGNVTGVTGVAAGSGISVSGTTRPTITNTGVLSFNGLTGAVTGVTTSAANTFTAIQSFNSGISAAGSTFTTIAAGSIYSNQTTPGNPIYINNVGASQTFIGDWDGANANTYILVNDDNGDVNIHAPLSGILTYGGITDDTAVSTTNGIGNTSSLTPTNLNFTGGARVQSILPSLANTSTITLPANSTTLTGNSLANVFTALQTFNAGITASGATFSGLATFLRGITASGLTVAGNGLVTGSFEVDGSLILGSGQSITQAVTSFNGLTGAVSGVTTSVANTFTALQTFNAGITTSGITLNGPIVASGLGTFSVGITTSGATFTGIAAFLRGITASGATFTGNINLQNGEFIRNTTDGRIDFMPAPAAANAYGLYVDATSWGFGPRLGTIRSSDNTTNNANILWDAPLVVANDVAFSLGSAQAYKFYMSSTGNDTMQVGLPAATSGYSSALALVDYAYLGNASRSPGISHAHPNLYIYSAGFANANDFIRFEHNRVNANIVTGQTSGILIQPGSGWLGVSGGISASGGITFTGQVTVKTFRADTIGGDEGGQIDFGLAATNTSLTGGVAIDVYQNRVRIFETGGTNRGGFIDLTTAAAGVGTNLIPQVTSVNGLTGAIGALIGPIAVTSGSYTVFTFPNGITATGSKRPYYQSPYYNGRATSTAAMVANRTYFILHNAPRGVSLTSLRLSTAGTGITGDVYLSVWSANTSNGLPNQRLYTSSASAVPTGFNFTTITNASGLVAVPAGSFYIAASFSSTPTVYVHSSDRNIHVFGSQDYTSGYNFYLPVMDTSGFTAPSSITQSGATFGFIDYYPTQITIPILEWQGT